MLVEVELGADVVGEASPDELGDAPELEDVAALDLVEVEVFAGCTTGVDVDAVPGLVVVAVLVLEVDAVPGVEVDAVPVLEAVAVADVGVVVVGVVVVGVVVVGVVVVGVVVLGVVAAGTVRIVLGGEGAGATTFEIGGGEAVLGVAVEPAITAGADSPPAVTRLATMPATTEPLAGTLVAEATMAWPRGVAETWVTSWIPVSTDVPAIADAAEEPAEPAPEANACEPAADAELPAALVRIRRSAARTGAVSTRGTATHAPLMAFVPSRVCCSFARARRTRALAFTSVMPSAPATSS